MSNKENELDKQWRKRIKEVGQKSFEFEEMRRLGFLSEEKVAKFGNSSKSELKAYEEAKIKLSNISRKLSDINCEIDSIDKDGEIAKELSKIRTQRIKRVQEKNAARKIQKEERRKQREKEIIQKRINTPTFLGKDVSNRLNFSGGNNDKLRQKGLPILTTFAELSSALDLKPQSLQWLVYDRDASKTDHYTRFEIPKRTGGLRLISSPKPALRKAQGWILQFLLQNLSVHSAAMAFRPGLSIVDNAQLHANSKNLVRIDLTDFFPSITFIRIRGFFESLGYNPGIATILSLICTDSPRVILRHIDQTHFVKTGERCLPQGACTSPALANLIANKLDRRIQKYTEKAGWIFSRYADDLVFSTNKIDMPPHRLIRAVSMIINDEGFTVNERKTNVMRAPKRQVVTGLIVNNNDVRISRKDIRRYRAFFHRCVTKGLEEVSNELGKDAVSVSRGYLAYIKMVSPETGQKISEQHPWIYSKK